MPKKPSAKTIRQMLDDVEFTVSGRYKESPDPTGGAFYMPLPTGSTHGVSFAELTAKDQADQLQTFIPWEDYEGKGVTEAQVLGIWQNVQAGKPREKWLEGTGLPEPSRTHKTTLEDLREAGSGHNHRDQSKQKAKVRDIDRDR